MKTIMIFLPIFVLLIHATIINGNREEIELQSNVNVSTPRKEPLMSKNEITDDSFSFSEDERARLLEKLRQLYQKMDEILYKRKADTNSSSSTSTSLYFGIILVNVLWLICI